MQIGTAVKNSAIKKVADDDVIAQLPRSSTTSYSIFFEVLLPGNKQTTRLYRGRVTSWQIGKALPRF
jgi:hypothetical protein